MFEPGFSRRETYASGFERTLITASPDTSRYKEFLKNKGIPLYMPSWEKNELMALFHYGEKNGWFKDSKTKDLYSEESVTERIRMFGGIIRHVFIESTNELEGLMSMRDETLNTVDVKKLLEAQSLEDAQISNYIKQYQVYFDKDDFQGSFSRNRKYLDFVSDEVKKHCLAKLSKVDFNVKFNYLKEKLNAGKIDSTCTNFFEIIFIEQLAKDSFIVDTSSSIPLKSETKRNQRK
jgi:hypothetical protein